LSLADGTSQRNRATASAMFGLAPATCQMASKEGAANFHENRKYGKFPPTAWNAQPANDPSGPTLDWIEARQAAYAKSRNDDPDDRDVPF
jgi:hypothetical protein